MQKTTKKLAIKKTLLPLERDPNNPMEGYDEWREYLRTELLPEQLRKIVKRGPMVVEVVVITPGLVDTMIGMESTLLAALEALKAKGGKQ